MSAPSAPRDYHAAAHHNLTIPGLLRLTPETLTAIILFLCPREAIFLSLTCRSIYKGILARENSYVWYLVGGFVKGLPGWSDSWNLAALSLAAEDPLQQADKQQKLRKGMGRTKRLGRPQLEAILRQYERDRVIDYKRILVDTMLGDTTIGCQWCLQQPLTRKVYENWKIRLCVGCFEENVITKFELSKLDIDILHLPVQDRANRTHMNRIVGGLWKRSVERLVRNRYGANITLQELIEEAERKFRTSTTEREKEALEVYRQRHNKVVFAAFQARWAELHAAGDGGGNPMIAAVQRFVPPEKINAAWMYEITLPYYSQDRLWRIKAFASDPLFIELQVVKSPRRLSSGILGELWQDQAWVDSIVKYRLDTLTKHLTENHLDHNWMTFLIAQQSRDDIIKLGTAWHMSRLRDEGADDLFRRACEHDPEGIRCPLRTCQTGRPQESWLQLSHHEETPVKCYKFHSLETFLPHMIHCHWDFFIAGDFDWLVGKPSRWWPKIAVRGRTSGTSNDIIEWLENAWTQEMWLKEWWPRRWKPEYGQLLYEWSQRREFIEKIPNPNPPAGTDAQDWGLLRNGV